MRSTITSRGQTVIPAAIRQHFGLSAANRLEWVIEDGGIHVYPVVEDPVKAFRGSGSGGSTRRLLQERAADRTREE